MTNKKIKQAEKELCGIEAMPPGDGETEIIRFLKKYRIHQIRKKHQDQAEWIEQLFSYAHTFLQTKMMLNSSKTAKWSCIWAAIATTAALIAATAAWVTVWLMLK